MTLAPIRLAALAKSSAVPERRLVNGVPTSYWVYGSDRESALATVVLVHGYRGNHHGLEAIAGALSDFHVIIPDLPGYGESGELTGEYSIANYAKWLAAFVTDVAPNSTVLGHSFGSIVVARAAAEEGLSNQIILLNPVCRYPDVKQKPVLQAMSNAFYSLCGAFPEPLGRALVASPLFVQLMSSKLTKTHNLRLRAWIHGQHLGNFSKFTSMRSVLEGYLASLSAAVSDFAPRMSNRTLLIIGERDDITSVATQQRNFATMPNANLIEISGVGHLTHYETPEQVARAIADFLAA